MPLASLLLVLLLLAVIGGIAVLAAGRGDSYVTAEPDRKATGLLPPGQIGRDDVRRLRFSLGFRGYRMDEVDAVLERLGDELEDRDRRLTERAVAERDASPDPGPAPRAVPGDDQGSRSQS